MRMIRLLSQTLSVALFVTSGTVFAQMGGGMGPGGSHGHDFDDFPGWQGHEIEHNVVLPQVAIRPMTFRQGFFAHSITPVQFTRTDSGRVRTGIAVVNPSDDEASLTLSLVDKTGTPILRKAINLAAGAQLAQFIDEIFDSLEEGFQGVLELSTDGEGIVSMGLLQTGLVTTSIPTHHYGNWQQNQ